MCNQIQLCRPLRRKHADELPGQQWVHVPAHLLSPLLARIDKVAVSVLLPTKGEEVFLDKQSRMNTMANLNPTNCFHEETVGNYTIYRITRLLGKKRRPPVETECGRLDLNCLLVLLHVIIYRCITTKICDGNMSGISPIHQMLRNRRRWRNREGTRSRMAFIADKRPQTTKTDASASTKPDSRSRATACCT